MEGRHLDEERVKDILKNKDRKLETIHRKLLLLYESADRESLYGEAAISGVSMDADGVPGTRGMHRDLSDVLERINQMEHARWLELREIMWELSEQEDTINRVWACFYALEDPFFTILEELYVKGELYATVERDFGYSHKTFEKLRAEGIRLIIFFYESGDSAIELLKRNKYSTRSRHSSGKKQEDTYGQMSLFNAEDNET